MAAVGEEEKKLPRIAEEAGSGDDHSNDDDEIDKTNEISSSSNSNGPRESAAKERAKELSQTTPERILATSARSQTALRILFEQDVDDSSSDEDGNDEDYMLRRRRQLRPMEISPSRQSSSHINHTNQSRFRVAAALVFALSISLLIAVVYTLVSGTDVIKRQQQRGGVVRQTEHPVNKMIRQCSESGTFDRDAVLTDTVMERRRYLMQQFITNVPFPLDFMFHAGSCKTSNQVLIWLASDHEYFDSNNAINIDHAATRFALGHFFLELGGFRWKKKAGWMLFGVDHCKGWYGVQCSSDDAVQRIRINGNRIKGTIPPTIGLLTHLEDIDLYHNEIRGAIPRTIGRLTSLSK